MNEINKLFHDQIRKFNEIKNSLNELNLRLKEELESYQRIMHRGSEALREGNLNLIFNRIEKDKDLAEYEKKAKQLIIFSFR